nr:pyrroline-5-carboxylate reductase-like [Malus domestica]
MCDYMQTVMHLGEAATVNDGELIADLFGAVGKVWKMDEKLSDAAGAVGYVHKSVKFSGFFLGQFCSGAGTAFAYIAIEAMADGGVVAGLPREICLSLASQAFYGAAAMVMKTGKHPGQLKDQVASPGGITIAGIHELEKGALRASMMDTVVAATKRSHEMGQ